MNVDSGTKVSKNKDSSNSLSMFLKNDLVFPGYSLA
jgi:hypothetical protein